MQNDAIVVLDVGKTMSKISLWTFEGRLLERDVRKNEHKSEGSLKVLDVRGIKHWLIETLTQFAAKGNISHIIPVTHGAAFAIIKEGRLAHAPLDYELDVSETLLSKYRSERDGFERTGSPDLSGGLNLGFHLYFLSEKDAHLFEGATLIPWAQYWAWYLTDRAVSEITALGCHTDLWDITRDDFSPMAKRLGYASKFAPMAHAKKTIGPIRKDLSDLTALPSDVEVHCGLHDSNAALVAFRRFDDVRGNDATLLSTGTWFVAMRSLASSFDITQLDGKRDCLVNLDVDGKPVPSSRFMGGREIQTLLGKETPQIDRPDDQEDILSAVKTVIETGAMVLPNFASGSGPFPHSEGCWVNEPLDVHARQAAIALYAALVANESLDLIGARNLIVVEGRFTQADAFVRALASLRPNDKIYISDQDSDVSFGAASLVNPDMKSQASLSLVPPLDVSLERYKESWIDLNSR